MSTLKEMLLGESNELTKKYWQHYEFLVQRTMQRIRKRRFAESRHLDEQEWQGIEQDAMNEVAKRTNFIWWMTWKNMHSKTLKALELPTKQKKFLALLDVSESMVGQWRIKNPWVDQYLDAHSHVGVSILAQYNDKHFHMTGMEGMRPDNVGLLNRRFSAELQGLLKQRVGLEVEGDVKAAIDLEHVQGLMDKAWGAESKASTETPSADDGNELF